MKIWTLNVLSNPYTDPWAEDGSHKEFDHKPCPNHWLTVKYVVIGATLIRHTKNRNKNSKKNRAETLMVALKGVVDSSD